MKFASTTRRAGSRRRTSRSFYMSRHHWRRSTWQSMTPPTRAPTKRGQLNTRNGGTLCMRR